MSVVAIIPARGGSKRIPGKNIKDFRGRPMMAHSLVAAKDSGLFDRIIVSTDDEAIMRVAREWGAEAPFVRPVDIAGDHATTDSVLLHALGWLERDGEMPDYACCLYAAAPFVTPEDLRRGLVALRESGAATAIAVTSFGHPIFRAFRENAAGRIEMLWPEHKLTRSQDLPEAIHDAGQFYWVNTARYMAEGRLFSADSVPVRLPRHRVQDIDTPEDWARAVHLGEVLQRERRS